MARTVRPLSDNQIKKAKAKEKDYKLFDGGGLFLLVKINGGKFWRAKYRFGGKEKSISFGKYPEVSLSLARDKLLKIKTQLANDINPTEKKKENKTANQVKFKEMSKEFLEFKSHELSLKHYNGQKKRLETYVYYAIGDLVVDSITKTEMVQLIKNIPNIKTSAARSTDKVETAHKLFNLLNQVFTWGVHNDLCKSNVMQKIDRSSLIAKRKVNHLKAITDAKEIRALYGMLKNYIGDVSTRNALIFLALTSLRSANIRGLKWDMVDYEKGFILFPAEVMKTDDDFRLPITKNMTAILESMKSFTGDKPYVFCSMVSKNKPLSENTLGYALKRMGIDNHTPHGFRSSFSTLCYEHQKEHGFSTEVIEAQLAHSIGNKVKLAYLRSDFLDDRLELMEWWDKFLNR